jgi:uncharacterized peroxidase-related enzyme
MRIRVIPEEEAEGLVAEQYEGDRSSRGYVANLTRAFSLRPEVAEAWGGLLASIRDHMDLRRYELATIAAAGALRCRYCMIAHGAVLRSKFFSAEEVDSIARDYRTAGLPDVDVAIMALAEKVALNAYKVTDEDIDELRRHGLVDEAVLDVILTAAARSFFSKTLDAVGAEPDDAYGRQLEPELLSTLSFPLGAAAAGGGPADTATCR